MSSKNAIIIRNPRTKFCVLGGTQALVDASKEPSGIHRIDMRPLLPALWGIFPHHRQCGRGSKRRCVGGKQDTIIQGRQRGEGSLLENALLSRKGLGDNCSTRRGERFVRGVGRGRSDSTIMKLYIIIRRPQNRLPPAFLSCPLYCLILS